MGTAHEILIKLAADSSSLVTGLNGASRQLDDFGRRASGVFSGFKTAMVAAFSVGAIINFTKSAIDTADALNDMAQRTGTSVETLSALSLVAEQNGTSLDGVAKGFKALSKNQMEAQTGSKEMATLFKVLGISGNNAMDSLIQVADQFAAMPEGMQRSALAQKLFGKAGEEMIPILSQGSAALREQIAWAEKHAGISTESAKRADAFKDKVAELNARLTSFAIALSGPILDALLQFNREVELGIKHFGSFGNALLKLGLTNPFKSNQEQIVDLRKEINKLTEDIVKFDAKRGNQKLLENMLGKLATKKAMLEYFLEIEKPVAAPPKAKPGAKPLPSSLFGTGKGAGAADDAFWVGVAKEQAMLMRGEETIAMAYERSQDAILNSIREAKDAFEREALVFEADAFNEEKIREFGKSAAEALYEKGILPRLDAYSKSNELTDKFLKPYRDAMYELANLPGHEERLLGFNALADAAYMASDTAAAIEALSKVEEERRAKLAVMQSEIVAGIKTETDAHFANIAINKESLSGFNQHIAVLEELTKRGYPPAIEAMQKYGAILADIKNQSKDKTWIDGIKQGLTDVGGKFNDTFTSARDATNRAFSSMTDALTQFVTTGKLNFKSLANSIIADMVRMVIQQNITKPLATASAAMFASFFPSAKGNVFSGPGISAYSGQIVNSPTVFPFAKGVGLMGEAGAEAIMPLTRTASGDLGVKAEGGGSTVVNVNFTVNAIDTQSALGVIMQHRSSIIGMVQGAFNKAGRSAPMIA